VGNEMKWLVYIPIHDEIGYPSYRKGDIAPVHKWREYKSHPLLEGTDYFWTANSQIDSVMGTYCGAPIRLLQADFTFGWDINNFNEYDGIIVCTDMVNVDAPIYLRSRYTGLIITMPRLPTGHLKYPKNVVECSNLILLNHNCGVENVSNLNRANNTNKFFLLPLPTVDIEFLHKNFFKSIEDKHNRVITYRPSSGPPKQSSSLVTATKLRKWRQTILRKSTFLTSLYLKRFHETAKKLEKHAGSDRVRTIEKTAYYLKRFQEKFPLIEGFMTKCKNQSEAFEPFNSICIKYADDFYDYVSRSRIIVLSTSSYASLTLYGACVGTPSVGSENTTMQQLLFPELSYDENNVASIVNAMCKLFEDDDYYVEQQRKALENVEKHISNTALKKRLAEKLAEFGFGGDV
jgi:hypothetical protein